MHGTGLRQFFLDNPALYGCAREDELWEIERVHALYPDGARVLGDLDVVLLGTFECRRCGACCSSVRYVPVCSGDIRRWLSQGRTDIISCLAVDRRRTPLLASLGPDMVEAAKRNAGEEAEAALYAAGHASFKTFSHVAETLYLCDLLENVVYVRRENGRCAFMTDDDKATCAIQETKPRACAKFPYYAGKYVDKRLIQKGFCPALKE